MKDKSGTMTDIYQKIMMELADNVGRIQFGEVSVQCKIHSGQIVSVLHSTLDNRLERVVAEGGGQ
ncbi:hypothetical protein AGMMS49944_09430 [Spirochaetia bacterium]|nr:hypothetical protein AGMMS49944_09430 [Spirochaetia bacterium]